MGNSEAMERLARFVDQPCALEVPDDVATWGRAPGKWQAIVFDWASVDPEEREMFITDSLADTFENAADLVPCAVIGPDGLHEIGTTLDSVGQFDAVLFLDVQRAAGGKCPVLLWNTDEPADRLREIAPDVGALELELLDDE
jgi:hypothetical protein